MRVDHAAGPAAAGEPCETCPPVKKRGYDIAGSRLEFQTSTCGVWDTMYEDCASATESIEFEQYILLDDAAGHRFLALFDQKARQGLRIKLLLDTVGSRKLELAPMVDSIRAHGGEVRFFNRIGMMSILMPWRIFPRDHCKTMIIDRKVAFVGSACMAAHMQHWRDTQVRLSGPIVADIARDFDTQWDHLGTGSATAPYISDEASDLVYASSQPRTGPSPIYRALLSHLDAAKESIVLVTPYFVPPAAFRRALRRAVRRGVDVTLMLSERTDEPVMDCVSHSWLNHLLRHGIKILLYRPAVLHAKYAIVDGKWATIGSMNMDYLSLVRNREANLILADRTTIDGIEEQFEDDRVACISIDQSYWRAKPLWFKAAGFLGRALRIVL